MWKCSCGAVFVSYLDRPAEQHKGHTFSLDEGIAVHPSEEQLPSCRDVPTTVPDDLSDAELPVTDTFFEEPTLPAFTGTVMSPDLDMIDHGDPVTSPSHYNQGDVECIDAIASCLGPSNFRAYCHGNAMKYLWRHEYKGKSSEDLAKANYYLNRMRTE